MRVDDPALIPLLLERIPPRARLSSAAGPVDRRLSVVSDVDGGGWLEVDGLAGPRVGRQADLLNDFDSCLRFALAEFSRRRIVVHAGVVGWHGRAAVIPGPSHSGKTSLVAALVAAGADYVSDEHALLDARGRVHPWPKPLSIRPEPGARQVETPADALGGRTATRALPVALIVDTRYRPDAVWAPRPLSAGEGALSLMANAIAARRFPVRTLAVLAAVAARARTLHGPRPDARETARAILALLERSD